MHYRRTLLSLGMIKKGSRRTLGSGMSAHCPLLPRTLSDAGKAVERSPLCPQRGILDLALRYTPWRDLPDRYGAWKTVYNPQSKVGCGRYDNRNRRGPGNQSGDNALHCLRHNRFYRYTMPQRGQRCPRGEGTAFPTGLRY